MDTITQDNFLQHIDPPNHTFVSAEKALEQMERARVKAQGRSGNEPGMPAAVVPIDTLRRAASTLEAEDRFKAMGYPVHVKTGAELQRMAANFPDYLEKLAEGWYFMWPRDGNGSVLKLLEQH